jgi:hypothetical protein
MRRLKSTRHLTQEQKDNRFVNQLIEVARDRFGDDQETDEAYLFALLCDAVRAYTVIDESAYLPKLLSEARPGDIAANTLGPIVANICPEYLVYADGAHKHIHEYEEIAEITPL